jgi:hypothetical protein
MANRIQNLSITAADLRRSGMPESFIKDYSLMAGNFALLSTQFQWLKLGSQAVTGAFQPLAGWSTDRDTGSFTVDSATGQITIPKTGDYKIDAFVQGDAATGITMKAQLYDGTSWGDIAGATAIATQHAVISGCLFSASVSQLVRLVVTGGAMNIVTNAARVSIGRKS